MDKKRIASINKELKHIFSVISKVNADADNATVENVMVLLGRDKCYHDKWHSYKGSDSIEYTPTDNDNYTYHFDMHLSTTDNGRKYLALSTYVRVCLICFVDGVNLCYDYKSLANTIEKSGMKASFVAYGITTADVATTVENDYFNKQKA